jgi:hypothetical protein
MKCSKNLLGFTLAVAVTSGFCASTATAQELGEKWGTEEREREYYRLVDVTIPEELVVEAGASSLCLMGVLRSARGAATSI